ncbi:glycosyltransferase [Bacillus sp. KH172YL63]|uniref:glycosyltransferase n=1 Tax=Bacillus sp. KH172YL63 TaxID=2709784 RepID=UPI0013E4851F|nr:glycosyltransferase [Bacillus sp. KH172YL63]BCB05865.1 glycosyl transferase [Bacillus sp. KH172YL63]
MSKRYLFITEYSGIGGGESSLYNLTVELNNSNHISRILTLNRGELNSKLDLEGIYNSEFNYKALIRNFKFFRIFKQLGKHLKQIDTVVLNSKSTLYLIPFIRIINSKLEIIYIEHSNWTEYRILERLLIKNCSYVLAVSKAVKRNLLNQINIKNEILKILPLGIPINNKNIKPKKITSNKATIAMIGRFQEIKGHDFFVNICKYINDKNMNVEFKIIGGKPFNTKEENHFESKVLDQIKKLGLREKVSLLGERKDILNLLEYEVDILIVPSLNESFGMVVIEAASKGVPIIVSHQCEGPVEVLTELDAENLITKRSVSSFYKVIFDLISNEKYYYETSTKLIKNVEKYNVQNIAQKFVNIK